MPVSPSEPSHAKCSRCDNTTGQLKRCAKCKVASYCNRECQQLHWKVHRKECARLAGLRALDHRDASGQGSRRSDNKPFTAIYNGNFLHGRTEEETFKILIDIIRMRQEDTSKFEAGTMAGTVYDGDATSERALREFLRKPNQVSGHLPPWWNDDKIEQCIRYGLQQDHDFSLRHAQEKSDVQENWGDDRMPMKLRMLGEKVYGNTPGGPPGPSGGDMLGMMMQMEG